MAPRSRKEILTDFRTSSILAAARRIFSAKGFERATMHEIAAAAGIATGTVYLYYPSKRAVFALALDDELQRQCALTDSALAAAESFKAQLRALLRAKGRYYDEHPDSFNLFFSHVGQAAAFRARLGPRLEQGRRRQVAAVQSALERAVQRREIRKLRPETAACALFDLLRGLVERRVRGWSRASLDDEVDATAELFWRGVMQR